MLLVDKSLHLVTHNQSLKAAVYSGPVMMKTQTSQWLWNVHTEDYSMPTCIVACNSVVIFVRIRQSRKKSFNLFYSILLNQMMGDLLQRGT